MPEFSPAFLHSLNFVISAAGLRMKARFALLKNPVVPV